MEMGMGMGVGVAKLGHLRLLIEYSTSKYTLQAIVIMQIIEHT